MESYYRNETRDRGSGATGASFGFIIYRVLGGLAVEAASVGIYTLCAWLSIVFAGK